MAKRKKLPVKQNEMTTSNRILMKSFYPNRNPKLGRTAFIYSTKYDAIAYEGFHGDENALYQFNIGERLLYGRINKNNFPIVLKRESKDGKIFGSIKSGESAVDFVADAFNDVISQFDRAKHDGRLRGSDVFSNFKVSSAFVDPYSLHERTINSAYNNFLLFLDINKYDVQIVNYNTFMKYYLMYMESLNRRVPTTLTGYIKSRHCSPLVSGLVIEISNGEIHGDSSSKYNNYITSENFCLFASIAVNHGFRIDKNIPWRLVADLDSPVMKKYMDKKLMYSTKQALGYYYEPAHYYGFEIFKKLPRLFYNSLVQKKPLIAVKYIGRCRQLQSRVIRRGPISIESAERIYNEEYWLEKYLYTRNIEEQNYLSEAALNHLIIDSKNLLLDKEINDVLDFAENKLINFHAKAGSFSDIANKIKLQNIGQSDTMGVDQATSAGAGSYGSGMGGTSGGGGGY